MRHARYLERKLNGGTRQHGVIAAVAALAPPVLVSAALFWLADAVHPALGLVVNVIVLYCLMGFRRFSHALSAIVAALSANDIPAARRALAAWRAGPSTTDLASAEIARLAIERGLVDAYRQVFGVIFWFVVLPGPAGAVLYRAAVLLAEEWRGPVPGVEPSPLVQSRAEFGMPARALLMALDASQRTQAVVNGVAPNEIVTTTKLPITPLSPVGIQASAMTAAQRELLMKVIDVYAGFMADDLAADRLARLKKAGLEKIAFAWAGEAERGKKHYYRIQGPTFLIEYDNTQNNGNHIHSVWRDFTNDFGRDLLREHIASVAHQ